MKRLWTIAAIKDCMDRAAPPRHWLFNPILMQFAHRTCFPDVFSGPGGTYFVTEDGIGFHSETHGYTVRLFNPGGNPSIINCCKVGEIASSEIALRIAKEFSKSTDICPWRKLKDI